MEVSNAFKRSKNSFAYFSPPALGSMLLGDILKGPWLAVQRPEVRVCMWAGSSDLIEKLSGTSYVELGAISAKVYSGGTFVAG